MRISNLLLLVFAVCAACGACAAGVPEKSFELTIVHGEVPAPQRLMKVEKGDALTLRITSDAPGELHLHGYQLAAKLAPGQPAEVAFTAYATGRYPLEWHGAGSTAATGTHRHAPPLATLEVTAEVSRARAVIATACGIPALACAHAFEERYDLPAPLSYFATGAAAVVVLSFVVAQVVVEHTPQSAASRVRQFHVGALLPALRMACRALALCLFALTIVSGFYGTDDPLMNLAPTMVWIIWWVGLSLVAACFGNIWPALDPWRTVYDMLDALARRAGASRGLALGWRYPPALSAWPAVVLLLSLSWFEVAYPQAAVPYRLACVALAWSTVTLLGMACFGADTWQRNADVFAVYFATLGRFAPLVAGNDARSVILRAPGRGLIAEPAGSAAMVCFVMAMLSTVLFDGLMSGQIWQLAQVWLNSVAPFLADPDGYRMGAVGLIGVWLMFLVAYALTCAVTAWLVPRYPPATIARMFAFTLVPIAIAYNIAHNCASFVVQAQQLIALASDPLGLKWDLFGTANFHPDIGLVDARVTWYVAISAIVAGHVIAIWLSHRLALREFGTRRRAALATVPLTLLMVAYTVISLSVIAEPMVTFNGPDATISR